MELWIISQGKRKLVKVNSIHINHFNGERLVEKETDVGWRETIENYEIWEIIANDCNCVGEYKTEQRALEVLNMICNLLSTSMRDKLILQIPEE